MSCDDAGEMEPLSPPPTGRTSQGSGLRHYLGVLVDLGEILLVAVDVQSDGGACAPSAAQSKDDARTVCKKEPQALGKITAFVCFFLNPRRESEGWKILRGPLGDLTSSIFDQS